MAQDVIITPANGEIQWQDNASGVAFADIDANNNLSITNPGGNLSIGDGSSDVYIGNGVANVDLVFEQDGEIRGTGSQTLTLGTSGDTIKIAGGTTFSVQTDLSFAANPEITWTSNFLDLYSTNAIGVVRILGNASYAPRFEIYTDAGTTKRIMLDPGSTSYIDGTNAKLGIGITSPTAKIHVKDASGNPAAGAVAIIDRPNNLAVANQTADNPELLISGHSSNYKLVVRDQSSNELIAVKGNGYVGMGTAIPGHQLHIYGDGASAQIQRTGQYADTITFGMPNGVPTIVGGTDLALGGSGTWTEHVRIKADGNVGIGTTSPGAPLHVYQAAKTAIPLRLHNYTSDISNDGTTTNFIDFYSTDDNATFTPQVRIGSVIQDQAGDGGIASEGHGNFVVYTAMGTDASGNGTLSEWFRVNHDGNVGVGTASPAYKLDIQGGTVRIGQATYNANLLFGNSSTWRSGIRTYDNGDAELRIWHRNTRGQIVLATGYEGDGSTSMPTDGLFIVGDTTGTGPALKVGIGYTAANLRGGTAKLAVNGDVGIGTTTPKTALDVFKTSYNLVASFGGQIGNNAWTGIHFGYIETANAYYRKSAIVFERQDSSARGKIHILNNAGATNASANLSDAKLTIQYDGNVGIGTQIPSSKLHVDGGSKYLGGGDWTTIERVSTVEDLSALYVQITGSNTNQGIAAFNYGATAGTANSGTTTFRVARQTSYFTSQLHVYGSTSVDNGSYGAFLGAYSGGTSISPGELVLATQAKTGWGPGDELGRIRFYLQDASGVGRRDVAKIIAVNEDGDGSTTTTASGALAFYTSAYNSASLLERLRIKKDGNVGIGTTSPIAKLNVKAASGSVGLSIGNTTGDTRLDITSTENSDVTFNIGDAAAGTTARHFIIQTGSSERLRIQNDGNVGIGITSPDEKLHVFSSSNPTIQIGGSLADGTTGGTSTLKWWANDGTYGNAISATYYKDATNDRLTFIDGGLNNILTLKNGGNVGIGTTTPSQKLEVAGASYLNSASGTWNLIGANGIDFARESRFGYSTSYPVLQLGTAAATRGIAIGVDVSGNASGLFQGNEIIIPNQRVIIAPTAANNSYIGVLGIDSSNNIRIGYSNYALLNNTPGITIETGTQEVGIGTIAPSYKLDVQGSASGTIARIRRTVLDQGNSGAVLLLELGENTGPENDPWIDFNNYGSGSGGGLAGSIATAQAQQGIRIHGNTNIDFDISSTLQSTTSYRQMKIDSSGATVYNSLGVGGSIATSRVVTITNTSQASLPAIKIVNPNINTSVASNGRTFNGWLPIDLNGTTKWIPTYN